MEAHKAKDRGIPKISTRLILRIAAIAVAAAMVAALCISIFNTRNIQSRYTAVRNALGDEVYQNLYMMIRRGEELGLAGADVQGTVLPAMKEYFIVARAFDRCLGASYGSRYAVLSEDELSALQRAFDAYDAAFKGGRSTDEPMAQLTQTLARVSETLALRYDEAGVLKPAS